MIDLSTYRGYKEANKDGKTGKMKIIDTRILECEIELAKIKLKELYNEKILEAVPEHKQRNMCLGLINGAEKKEAVNTIKALITEYEARKKSIDKAKTCDDVIALAFEGLI